MFGANSIKYWMYASGAFAIFYVYTLASSYLEIWPSKAGDVAHNAMVRKYSIGLLLVCVAIYSGLMCTSSKK